VARGIPIEFLFEWMPWMHASRWLTVADTARSLRLSQRTVYTLLKRGDLKSVKVGRSRRVLASELDAFEGRLLDESGRP
jgi:excisionase family DNA binding protein